MLVYIELGKLRPFLAVNSDQRIRQELINHIPDCLCPQRRIRQTIPPPKFLSPIPDSKEPFLITTPPRKCPSIFVGGLVPQHSWVCVKVFLIINKRANALLGRRRPRRFLRSLRFDPLRFDPCLFPQQKRRRPFHVPTPDRRHNLSAAAPPGEHPRDLALGLGPLSSNLLRNPHRSSPI